MTKATKDATKDSGTSQPKTKIIDTEADSGPGPSIMAADTLEGDSVVNKKGESIGEIKSIMLDVKNGKIAYAVMASGGFLGLGDKLFAIPWSALTLDVGKERFVLDVEKERLQDAPGFDKNHWPTMADSKWATEVHEYYGQENYLSAKSKSSSARPAH